MICTQNSEAQCIDRNCAKCKNWRASETAEDYFAGRLDGALYNTLSSIYFERVREGRF